MSNPYFVKQIALTLEAIQAEGQYADRRIEQVLREHPEWSQAERGDYVTTCYELLSQRRRLEVAVSGQDAERVSPWLLWGAARLLNGQTLPDWPQLEGLELAMLEANLQGAARAVTLSYPDWLDAEAAQQLGAQWETVADALNQRPRTFLRTNTLKCDRATLLRHLESAGIDAGAASEPDTAVEVASSAELFKSKAFQDGEFEMQDWGSQQIAPMLNLKRGMRVVDACCGAGGKSLQIAALMENKGYLLAMDIHEQKLQTLKKRAKRAGVQMIETRVIKNSKTVKRLKDKFDRVLLDVPCSGTGVFKRNPDAKWHLSEDDVDNLIRLQAEILQRYSQMCKPGGQLVYATCSILPAENQQQIAAFLENNPHFRLDEERVLLPGINSDGDGFYAARLERIA